MAEKQASYIQASSHPADTDRLTLEGLLNPSPAPVSGAGYGVGPVTGDLLVTQNGTPNMSVNVAAGHVWIDGTESATQGAYHCYNDATKNLVVAASDPTNPRKDLVVAKVQDAAYSGAVNAWTLAVVTGTPAASPAEPTVPANAVVLAMINVAALATTITNANITDRRRRACGLSGIAVCTSTTRPSAPYAGQEIFETDTAKVLVYDGTGWVEIVTAGAWSDFTPVITQGTTPTFTKNYSKFTRMGRTILWNFGLTLTGAGTAGNRVGITIPVTAAAAVVGMDIGIARVYDQAPGTLYDGVVNLTTSTGIFISTQWSDVWGVLPNLALASGDIIRGSVQYEAAT